MLSSLLEAQYPQASCNRCSYSNPIGTRCTEMVLIAPADTITASASHGSGLSAEEVRILSGRSNYDTVLDGTFQICTRHQPQLRQALWSSLEPYLQLNRYT